MEIQLETATQNHGSGLIKCTVISCPNYFHKDLVLSPDDIHFFPFPSNEDKSRCWKEKCGIAANHDIQNAHVCSTHFKQSDFTSDLKLGENAVPTENLGWMVGMPEVKLGDKPKFDKFAQSKEAVDLNEQLVEQFEKLVEEQKQIKEKLELYKKKNENVENEILRLKHSIGTFPHKKKNGSVTDDLISKVFSPAQINMLMGKKKVVWSYDDMAMAFTLRHIGNRECYLYLKDVLNMPLPALSAVQRWVASNKI